MGNAWPQESQTANDKKDKQGMSCNFVHKLSMKHKRPAKPSRRNDSFQSLIGSFPAHLRAALPGIREASVTPIPLRYSAPYKR